MDQSNSTTISGRATASRIDPRASVAEQASIAPRCTISSGAYVGVGVVLEADVFVGPNVAFVDGEGTNTRVEQSVWIGANATIYPGLLIGSKAVVRPGSVVTRPVPPGAVVEGNPATIVGYVDAVKDSAAIAVGPKQAAPSVRATAVKGVTLHTLPLIPDMRGSLTVCEFERQVPFVPRRTFMVFDVPSREVRGEHAHLRCHQFLICVRGSCAVVADDGTSKVEVTLDTPNLGLYLPPLTWGIQYKYSSDALLMVFASDYYEPTDYIRSYSEFLATIQSRS